MHKKVSNWKIKQEENHFIFLLFDINLDFYLLSINSFELPNPTGTT